MLRLKVKDSVDLKRLEDFGFTRSASGGNYHLGNCHVHTASRLLMFSYTPNFTGVVLFKLFEANLIEIVEVEE